MHGIKKMAERRCLSKSDNKVKCKDENIPENVNGLEDDKGKSC